MSNKSNTVNKHVTKIDILFFSKISVDKLVSDMWLFILEMLPLREAVSPEVGPEEDKAAYEQHCLQQALWHKTRTHPTWK